MIKSVALLMAFASLSACDPTPIYTGKNAPTPTITAFQLPACFLICTLHLSLIREDALSMNSTGSLSTGGNTSSQTSSGSNTGGGRSNNGG